MLQQKPLFQLKGKNLNVFEWSTLHKTQLILTITGGMAMSLSFLFWLMGQMNFDYSDQFDPQVRSEALCLSLIYLALAVVLFCTGFHSHFRDKTDVRFYNYVSLMFHASGIVMVNHYMGEFTLLTGVTISSVILIGWILFDFTVVNIVFGSAIAVTLVLFMCKVMGYMDYMPLVPNDVEPEQNTSWLILMVMIALPQFFVPLIVAYISIKRWRKREAQVKHQATTDQLTGLYNRRKLIEILENSVAQSKVDNTNLSVLLMDLDYFKKVNDQYGHLVGDEVLKTVAKCLRRSVRKTDKVGRYGGEEFSVVLPKTDGETAKKVAERCNQAVQCLQFSGKDGVFGITISIGVSCLKPTDQDCEWVIRELMKSADNALYQAKKSGRNCVAVHQSTVLGVE